MEPTISYELNEHGERVKVTTWPNGAIERALDRDPRSGDAPFGWLISRYAFMGRFSDPELIAIDLAGYGQTEQAAAIRLYRAKVDAAKWIDLQHAPTRAGVQALESAGLLATGRASQILDTPAAAHEVP